jgi:iron complex transport system substrate-binding protein
MPVSASLLAASGAVRIASLNLCTDEYLLLAASRKQIASVSRLAADRDDSPLWRVARGIPVNNGTLEDIIAQRPTILLTMGGGGRSTRELAKRLGIQTVDLQFPQSIDDVVSNLEIVARLSGQQAAVPRWKSRVRQLQASKPAPRPAAFVGQGGTSVSAASLAASWMTLAGLRQMALPGGKVTAELLMTNAPPILLKSNYRARQMSQGRRWLGQPWVREANSRIIETDGRHWTCAGPLMPYEIERLRGLL